MHLSLYISLYTSPPAGDHTNEMSLLTSHHQTIDAVSVQLLLCIICVACCLFCVIGHILYIWIRAVAEHATGQGLTLVPFFAQIKHLPGNNIFEVFG